MIAMPITIRALEMPFPGESTLWLLVATDSAGEIVGTVSSKMIGLTMEFNRLFIPVASRRKRIGRLLVERVVKAATEAKCESVSCIVNPDNKDAFAFYRSLGFFHVCELDGGNVVMALQCSQ
jgi:ribosomal protein S18 acetylase RimI-like enzyme